MREVLEAVERALPKSHTLAARISVCESLLKPPRYSSLECTLCYAQVALDAFRLSVHGVTLDTPIVDNMSQRERKRYASNHSWAVSNDQSEKGFGLR